MLAVELGLMPPPPEVPVKGNRRQGKGKGKDMAHIRAPCAVTCTYMTLHDMSETAKSEDPELMLVICHCSKVSLDAVCHCGDFKDRYWFESGLLAVCRTG
eukprot:216559-Amphidinium_carterae.1